MNLSNLIQKVLVRYDGWLYNAALTKIVYLIDVESVRKYGKQATDIKWIRHNHGPFVWDILNCAEKNKVLFSIIEDNRKRKICLQEQEPFDSGEKDEGDVDGLLDEIIKGIPDPKKNFMAFVDYVYETPPMLLSTSNGPLKIYEAMESAKEVDELADELFNDPEWDEAFEYLASH